MKKIFIIGALSLLMIFSSCTQYVWIPIDPDIINGGNTGSERLTAEEFALKLDLAGSVEDVADGTPTTTSFTGMKVSTTKPTTASMAFVTKAAGAGKLYLEFTGEGYATGNGIRIMDGLIELTFDTGADDALSAFHLNVLEELVTLYGTDDEPYTVGVTAENEAISGKLQGTMTVDTGTITFSTVANVTVDIGSSLFVDGDKIQAGGVTGNGTSASTPFVLTTADQLFAFAADYNAGDFTAPVYVELGNDVDLGSKEWTPIGFSVRSGMNYTADSHPFIGEFNGNGHLISGLSITKTTAEDSGEPGNFIEGIGFFSGLSEGAVVENLRISGTINVPQNESAGFIAGLLNNSAVIEDCVVENDSSITAKEAGGIIGRMLASGSVKRCTNNATVTATGGKAGGIANVAYYDLHKDDATSADVYKDFTIENCTNNGTVSSSSSCVGGIIGFAANVQIKDCVNNGNITNGTTGIGGRAGELKYAGIVDNCQNYGAITITGRSNDAYGLGGLVGWIRYNESVYNTTLTATIRNSANYGDITTDGGTGIGGAVGMIYTGATIKNTENSGIVSLTDTGSMVGGFIGGMKYGDGVSWNENRNTITVSDCSTLVTKTVNGQEVQIVQIPDNTISNGIFIGHSAASTTDKPVTVTFTNCTPSGEGSGIPASN